MAESSTVNRNRQIRNETVGCKLPVTLKRLLENIAEEEGVSVSGLIRPLLIDRIRERYPEAA